MTKRALVFFIGLLGVGIALGLFALRQPADSAAATHPFIYGQVEIVRFLNRRGVFVEVVDDVIRNAAADELFIVLFAVETNKLEALRITTNGVTRIASPGRRVFAPSDDHFGAWLTKSGDGVVFADGSSIELPRFGLFNLDPSGKYFVVGEKPSTTWIGRASSPRDQDLLVDDVLGSDVFVRGALIYVCGTTPSGAVCLVVEDSGGRFRVRDRHSLNWASGIVDVDPDANRLLLWNNSDLFTTAYVYDLDKKQRSRVGGVKGFEFFLKHDLLTGK